jgi:hypothetical protein
MYLSGKGIQYFNLGGVTWIKDKMGNGLTQFKRCWSNRRSTVYFCDRVFDGRKYESICQQNQLGQVEYFPAYRGGGPTLYNLIEKLGIGKNKGV